MSTFIQFLQNPSIFCLRCCKILILQFLISMSMASDDPSGCDVMVVSGLDSPKNGTFFAPKWQKDDNHTESCTYTFVASENERVLVKFDTFDLRGSPLECLHEYLDIYNEASESDKDFISTPFGGRFCGKVLPKDRISLYQTLALIFHTDQKVVDKNLFSGTYEFIDASPFIAGTPTPQQLCSYTVYSDQRREGTFQSPTYPGVYPKNIECRYLFKGRKGQRIRIEFVDLDLLYGGSHCPFDRIQVYDGDSLQDPLIGPFCGQKRSLSVYSFGESVLVVFKSMPRNADHQNRGYSANYEFSERFVNLGFIEKIDAEHIRGTECDQRIMSRGENNGTIYSPNYPFLYHSNTVCKYYIYGLDEEYRLEKVRLEFEKFEIPITRDQNKAANEMASEIGEEEQECDDNAVRIYTTRGATDAAEPDYIFCATDKIPAPVVSDGPMMVIMFTSGTSQGQGFKARYFFEVDYRIPGTQLGSGCKFEYLSEISKSGAFNSPRYPHNYFLSTTCEYTLISLAGERIEINFSEFFTNTTASNGTYNEDCIDDWLEMYEVMEDGKEAKIGRYCNVATPGPYISPLHVNRVKMIMFSDDFGVAKGFDSRYEFLPQNSLSKVCGENFTDSASGFINSPWYSPSEKPVKTLCNWYITVRPKHKIFLSFRDFKGKTVASGGCPYNVVRVWVDMKEPPMEVCSIASITEIVSKSNVLKVQYVITDMSPSESGFQALWTEIKGEESECNSFRCASSGYCIADQMKCDTAPNCGHNDSSDEVDCIKVTQVNELMMVSMIAVGTILFFIVFCSLCHQKHKHKHKRRRPSETIADHYDIHEPKTLDEAASTFVPPYLHVDSV